MRQGNMRDITIDDVKRILKDKVEQTLKYIYHYHWDTNRFDEEEIQKRIAETQKKEREFKDHLKKDYKGTLGRIEKEVEKILKKENIIQDKKNVDYKGLIGRWTELRILRESWKRELLNDEGKTTEAFKKDLDEKWKMGLFASNTEVSYLDFIEIVGDKPISDYTRNDARDYRNIISKLPKNRRKIKNYRDKSINELLKMEIPDSHILNIETQTKLNSRIIAIWNFMIDEYNDYVTENVFKRTSNSKITIRKKDKKDQFTKDDMKVIFDPKNYLSEIIDNQYQRTKKYIYPYYFIPILAVHTGCRLEELCMMKTEDIVKVGKVWVYKIKEKGDYGDEETKVKTESSERDIPLHSILIDTIGFLDYVKFIREKGHERVFHELPFNSRRKNFQKNVGRFFNERYLVKLGLKSSDRKLSFHSFRHSVETHLTEMNVNPKYQSSSRSCTERYWR